ncbi:hypothetical protein, partial [Kitasatospora sp. NPDC056789]|uniref:hypothetical protein n=1 Tax=Kitasatospora sp. NPDC056789 TaxID=3345945 RepID=UPI0036A00D9E
MLRAVAAADTTDATDDMEALKHLHDGGDYRRLAERTSNPDVLRRLAIGEYPFVWHAIADNPAAPTDLLAALVGRRQQVWNDNRLLRLLAAHPALTGEALDGLVDLVGDRLREGDRPYAQPRGTRPAGRAQRGLPAGRAALHRRRAHLPARTVRRRRR